MYDIEGFVARHFVDYKVNNNRTDIAVNCPFCDDRVGKVDTKYHLQIHLDQSKQVVHCYRCDYAGSWINFARAVTGLPVWQVLSELYIQPKIREDVRADVSKKLSHTRLDDIKQEHSLPDDFQLVNPASSAHSHVHLAACKYLRNRGFNSPYWKYYNLGVAESVPCRVIIPIDQGYWQGRAIYPWMEPKYHNPSEPHDDVIFNSIALEMYDEIVVCEGAFSAMAVARNAVALIGKNPTNAKVKRLITSTVSTFNIALEQGAFGTVQELADRLTGAGKKVIIWRYENGDPADGSSFTVENYTLRTKVSLLLANRLKN